MDMYELDKSKVKTKKVRYTPIGRPVGNIFPDIYDTDDYNHYFIQLFICFTQLCATSPLLFFIYNFLSYISVVFAWVVVGILLFISIALYYQRLFRFHILHARRDVILSIRPDLQASGDEQIPNGNLVEIREQNDN